MSWASRRRFVILVIVGAIIVAAVALLSIATFSKAPSCSDGVQNQGEAGIDCGGPCPYLCTAQVAPPTVLFATTLQGAPGRTDVIASVENVNAAAGAKNVPYTLTIYGAGQLFVQSVQGTLDLPPAATVPVFIPGVVTGTQTKVHAFLSIDTAAIKWTAMPHDPRLLPVVSNTSISGASTTPRVTATLSNPSTTPLSDVPAVVLVRDAQGNVIAASSTIVPSVPAQGQATATFTWNAPFPGAPAAIEVDPTVPLP